MHFKSKRKTYKERENIENFAYNKETSTTVKKVS